MGPDPSRVESMNKKNKLVFSTIYLKNSYKDNSKKGFQISPVKFSKKEKKRM